MTQKGFVHLIILVIGLVVLAAIGGGGYYLYNQLKLKSVADFESCARIYPVLTSYPGQCNTPDGRHFVQLLSNNEGGELTPLQMTPEASTISSYYEDCIVKKRKEYKDMKYVKGRVIIDFGRDVADEEIRSIITQNNLKIDSISHLTGVEMVTVLVPEGQEIENVCKSATFENVTSSNLDFIGFAD